MPDLACHVTRMEANLVSIIQVSNQNSVLLAKLGKEGVSSALNRVQNPV
jgi:hypothetical protein